MDSGWDHHSDFFPADTRLNLNNKLVQQGYSNHSSTAEFHLEGTTSLLNARFAQQTDKVKKKPTTAFCCEMHHWFYIQFVS